MVNSLENFGYVFDKALEDKFIDRIDQNQEVFARYMQRQGLPEDRDGMGAEESVRRGENGLTDCAGRWRIFSRPHEDIRNVVSFRIVGQKASSCNGKPSVNALAAPATMPPS